MSGLFQFYLFGFLCFTWLRGVRLCRRSFWRGRCRSGCGWTWGPFSWVPALAYPFAAAYPARAGCSTAGFRQTHPARSGLGTVINRMPTRSMTLSASTLRTLALPPSAGTISHRWPLPVVFSTGAPRFRSQHHSCQVHHLAGKAVFDAVLAFGGFLKNPLLPG